MDVHSGGLELQSATSAPWWSAPETRWSAEEGERGEDNRPGLYSPGKGGVDLSSWLNIDTVCHLDEGK